MTWNSAMGFVSTLALFLPICFILLFRLGNYKSFPALLAYYTIVLIINLLTEGYITANSNTIKYWSISANLLDAPLMLLFLTYFSTSDSFTRKMKILIFALLVFELGVVIAVGFNAKAVTIFLGPALLIVFTFTLHFFVRQTKIAIAHYKRMGKAVIAASLLFAYGCYSILYLLYYVFKLKYKEDTFLVYFWVATFSSLLMCAGIIIERKRVKKLNELKVTRKELSDFYPETKTAAPLRTAMLDFDKDQWN